MDNMIAVKGNYILQELTNAVHETDTVVKLPEESIDNLLKSTVLSIEDLGGSLEKDMLEQYTNFTITDKSGYKFSSGYMQKDIFVKLWAALSVALDSNNFTSALLDYGVTLLYDKIGEKLFNYETEDLAGMLVYSLFIELIQLY